ncbi:MAG TPA: endolytic transglycosylase MltG [Humidesulfovibrio sp.]|uniref:endolytic transglycosylase MltG n=1 Tax=Humidesulfovibrio sp. TaxID=2910988 RepID=UPI002C9525ED|nr:endolytic transglycosylase MltG [Humidesulfovibrio sp.]HWR02841.1 endolytic transglycosylase MltG [Humidesulfovibrio sp.]
MWLLLGFAATIAAAFAGGTVYFLGPAEAPGREAVVLIRPGMTLPAIARELESQGLIRNAQALVLIAKLNGHMASAKAGEFLLSSGWPAQEILRVITTTNGIQHKVVVREGLPWWMAAKLFEAENLTDRESFEQASKNATLLQKYAIPADSAEGFLFPETYQLPRTQADNGTAVVEAMLREFDRQAKKLWPQGPPPAAELRRIVILASLVERETGDAAERPRIAGVFMNRLRLGMRLQCDPTTIYGLGPAFDGDLKRAHLEDAQNPYNTYAHAGLPPGPICSPGLASLQAALNPEAHDYIYFVAKGDGTHEFSATLDEHNRAVNRYQRHRNPEAYQSAPSQSAAAAVAGAKPEAKPAAKATVKTPAKTAKDSKAKEQKSKAQKAKDAKAKNAAPKDSKPAQKPQTKPATTG